MPTTDARDTPLSQAAMAYPDSPKNRQRSDCFLGFLPGPCGGDTSIGPGGILPQRFGPEEMAHYTTNDGPMWGVLPDYEHPIRYN